MSLYPGVEVRISCSVKDPSGALVAPDTMTLKVKDPSGTITPYTGGGLDNPSVGVYRYDLILGASGTWFYRWEATGANAGADEGFVKVAKSNVV